MSKKTPGTSDYYVGPNHMINTKGPVLVRFSSTEQDSTDSKHLDVYIDVTKIMVFRGWGTGSRIILEGNALVDLADTCDEVLEKLRKTMEEML